MKKFEIGKIYKLKNEKSFPFSYIKIEDPKDKDSTVNETELENEVFGQTLDRNGSPRTLRAVVFENNLEEKETTFDKSVIQSGKLYNITGGIFIGDTIEVMHKSHKSQYYGKVFLEGTDLYQELLIDTDHIGEEV